MHSVTIKGLSLGEVLRGEAGVHKLQLPAEGRRRAVRLARVDLHNGAAPSAGTPALVRVYHLGGAAYVRDPRTGHRSGQPRDVLGGAIDGFLLAYLQSTAAPAEL